MHQRPWDGSHHTSYPGKDRTRWLVGPAKLRVPAQAAALAGSEGLEARRPRVGVRHTVSA
jgi:hypothetical protein